MERERTRYRKLRIQLDETDEDLNRERNKARNLQRQIDDLHEANETLTRDYNALRSNATRRTTLTSAASNRRQYGSSSTIGRQIGNSTDNLNRTEDNESVGTDGSLPLY